MIATKCPSSDRIGERQEHGDHDAVDERLARDEPDERCGERDEGELDGVVEPVERQEPRRLAERRDEPAPRRRLAVGVGELRQPGVRAGDVHHVVERLVQHDDEREQGAIVVQRKSAGNSSG